MTDRTDKKECELGKNIFLPESDEGDCNSLDGDSEISNCIFGFETDRTDKKECEFGRNIFLFSISVYHTYKLLCTGCKQYDTIVNN